MPNKETTKDIQRYLVSAGDNSEDEYGLYILDPESDQHIEDMLLVYYYDTDRFTHIREKDKALFVRPADLVIPP